MRMRTIVAVALSALAVTWATEARAQKEPVRIGVLLPQTGPFAANGKDMQNGIVMFFEEQHYKMAGRDIKLLIEDTAANPAIGLTKARSLVEAQGAQVLIGPLNAAVGYALAPYITEKKIPSIYPIVSADDITQRKRSPYIIRTGWASSQPSQPFGQWVWDNLHYKKIATIGYDFAFGWEVVGGFQRTYELAGGEVVQKLWTPQGTADFGPYIAQLRRDVDAVFAQFSGADALRFSKQYQEAGLKGRLPLIGGGTFTDEHVLRSMGDEVLGVITPLHYSGVLTNPANKKFAALYEAKYHQVPSYYSEGGYVAGMVFKAALDAVHGNAEDKEALLAAIRKVNMSDAPRGPFTIDAYNNPIENIYIRKVEKVNGKLQNTVIYTFPKVSQFWKWTPEEFLKNPVYSRDFPPCKFCGK